MLNSLFTYTLNHNPSTINSNMKEMKYSEAVSELEGIVAKMQSPDCDIDSLASYTSRALELLKFCKEKLFTTDEEVKKCLETLSDSLDS